MIFMKKMRQKQIAQMLERDSTVTTAWLAQHFGVSIETIRRDFRQMEKLGMIRKVYGGAERIPSEEPAVSPFPIRYAHLHETKSQLALCAAKYVPEGGVVALDSGTTIFECVKALAQKKNMSYICNDVHSATELLAQGNTDVYLLGGKLTPYGTASGSFASEFLDSISAVDILLMSCDGGDVAGGLSCDDPNINRVKQILVKKAAKTIVVMDHTKFQQRGFYRTCGFSDVDVLITDSETPENVISEIRSRNVIVEIINQP